MALLGCIVVGLALGMFLGCLIDATCEDIGAELKAAVAKEVARLERARRLE